VESSIILLQLNPSIRDNCSRSDKIVKVKTGPEGLSIGRSAMAAKTIKLEIPFQKLIFIIDQLDTDEKLILKKKLEKQKVTTWQARFSGTLQALGKKNMRFSEKEVADDIKRAIKEVRA
jgi:hypothetical protein